LSLTDNPDLDLLKQVGSPLRIAQTLTPHLFGVNATFHADPWLALAELAVMRAISNRDEQSFIKINAPPQCGKSTFVEVFTALWALSKWPDTRIILIAYSDDIAIRSGALVRDIIMRWGPELFGISIDPNYESKQEWRIQGHMGGMLSVGIGSRITGMPGDLILVGDVIKGMEEAASVTTKGKHWDEFHGAILPRQQPGGTMILAATRFAEDDLSGRIDAQMKTPDYEGDHWESMVFKAIAEPDFDDPHGEDPDWTDLLGRVRGEPLKTRFSKPGEAENPEMWHDSHFYRRKRAAESAGQAFLFSCVFQQEPTSPTGGMFPPDKWGWFNPDDKPYMTSQRRSWDLAASQGGGDYTTGAFTTKDQDGNFYVQEMVRVQQGAAEVKDTVELHARLDGVAVPIKIEASRNGDGKAIVVFYQLEMPNYTITAANADGSKEDRAKPYSTLQQAGKVRLPRYTDGTSPEWVAGFIDEHRKMMGDGRRGRHDDQIDVVAHAINDMLDAGPVELLNPDIYLARSERTNRFIPSGMVEV